MIEMAKEDKILIGWGTRDITPEGPAILVGQFHVRISESVNDPLTVTALALESEDKNDQAIMVSVDTAIIPDMVRDSCREILKQKIVDFDPLKLFLSATHTHSACTTASLSYPEQGPDVMSSNDYEKFLIQRISEAACQAWQNRTIGAVSWGCGQAVVGFNRRMSYFDGTSKMYGETDDEKFSHIEGYEDHGVDFLFTYDKDKRLTGMVVNLACPAQVTEGSRFVSADFWHEARTEIRKRHGENLFILPQCSAAGDQSPHLMLKKRAEARMLNLQGLGDGGQSDRASIQMLMAQRQVIGRRIANAVDEVLPVVVNDIRDCVVLKHKTVLIDLPRRMVTESEKEMALEQVKQHKDQMAACVQDPADPQYSRNYVRIRYFQRVVDRYEEQKTFTTLPIEMHIIRLGDIAFATNRFEYFLDYGERIKARSKAVQTFVVQLTGAGTYLPTQRAVDAASYGAGIESNLVGPEGGQLIVNEQVGMINEMFSD